MILDFPCPGNKAWWYLILNPTIIPPAMHVHVWHSRKYDFVDHASDLTSPLYACLAEVLTSHSRFILAVSHFWGSGVLQG